MKAPFHFFGGKCRIADRVWMALGDVHNYVEPFGGSLAVLLARPGNHSGEVETTHDCDFYLVNFWRAVTAVPEEVALHADFPVSETDLLARHRWLVRVGKKRLAKLKMRRNPTAYDAKVAGWWLWGLCQWIGAGWCAGEGENVSKLPALGSGGGGIHRTGLFTDGQPDPERIKKYMRDLAFRMRRVRVCCGSWERVITDGALSYGGSVGIFLDPPYAGVKSDTIYRTAPGDDISAKVREWCIEHGEDKRLRIVLAGYSDEHEHLMPKTWKVHAYSAGSSFQSAESSKRMDEGNQLNKTKERLWLSPGCVDASVPKFSLLNQITKRKRVTIV